MLLGEILGEVLDHLMFLFSQCLQPCADYSACLQTVVYIYFVQILKLFMIGG